MIDSFRKEKDRMSQENRTADEVVKEKYEEQGWNQETDLNRRRTTVEPVKPISLAEEEYKIFSSLLAKIALQDKNPELCETYFELQRRAYYGNGYSPIEEMAEIEQEMWSLGTGEIIEDTEKHTR